MFRKPRRRLRRYYIVRTGLESSLCSDSSAMVQGWPGRKNLPPVSGRLPAAPAGWCISGSPAEFEKVPSEAGTIHLQAAEPTSRR